MPAISIYFLKNISRMLKYADLQSKMYQPASKKWSEQMDKPLVKSYLAVEYSYWIYTTYSHNSIKNTYS